MLGVEGLGMWLHYNMNQFAKCATMIILLFPNISLEIIIVGTRSAVLLGWDGVLRLPPV